MKLNIYTISHPITQLLFNQIQNLSIENNVKYHAFNKMGQFLIYETTRNWMKVYNLKIKTIDRIREYTIHNPNESYVIIANINNDLDLIQEAKYILPNCKISLIDFNKNIDSNYVLQDSNLSYIPKNINQLTKIIIASKNININNLIKVMDYLINIKNIKINQVRIMCIICESDQLITISQEYPQLNIYTTQIRNSQQIG
uniref:Uracil phosphoribosyltransferase n=1 Tax=Synarthrophyton chejuense TaxID=2485825 RepID=A0A3G3MFS3_9FLOR|nr:uracil phosphoribosyltransferase [Synarthrophyton chejuense]AYR05672.1 uracil phosphoribosyltransferase [Synarthrophyton chejuense]